MCDGPDGLLWAAAQLGELVFARRILSPRETEPPAQGMLRTLSISRSAAAES